MSCEAIQSLFSDHLDGLLSAAEEDRLGAHVAGCAGCRAALAGYETSLQALAGAAPPPPAALGSRTMAAARREGLIGRGWARPRPRWLVSLAAALAVFALGYGFGRRAAPPGAANASFAVLPASCGTDLVPVLDETALRTAPPERVLSLGTGTGEAVRVPASLLSHGPYTARPARALAPHGGSCVPLTAAYGETLVLVVVPQAGHAPAGFVVESDPGRVLYARVRWVKAGLSFSLEGRGEGRELLELAQEIAGGTRVVSG